MQNPKQKNSASLVCDVNSEKERLQVIFFSSQKIGGIFDDLTAELALCHSAKTEKNKNIVFKQARQLSLAPVRACVAPVCNFKSKVEVVTYTGNFEPC